MKASPKTVGIILASCLLIISIVLGFTISWSIPIAYISVLIVVGIIYVVWLYFKTKKLPLVEPVFIDEGACRRMLETKIKNDKLITDEIGNLEFEKTEMAGATGTEKTTIRIIICKGKYQFNTRYAFMVDCKNPLKTTFLINPTVAEWKEAVNILAETPVVIQEVEKILSRDELGNPILKTLQRSETKQEKEKRKEEEAEKEAEDA